MSAKSKSLSLMLLVFVTCAIACKQPAPRVDASAPPPAVATSTTNAASPSSVLAHIDDWRTRAAKAQKAQPKVSVKKGGAADPHVVACANSSKTLDELTVCFEPLKHAQVLKPGALGAARPPIDCPFQAVPDWYFSDTTGNNNNSCTVIGSPCKTPREVEARWGCGGSLTTTPTIAQATTFHFLDSMPLASHFTVDPTIVGPGGSFAIQCALTQTAAGNLATVTSKNNLAGQPLTADLGAGAATYVNKLLVNTTRNASSFVDSIRAGTVALLDQPLSSTFQEVDTYANNDAFTIQQPSTLYLDAYRPTCGIEHSPAFFVNECAERATLVNCNIPSVAVAAGQFQNAQLYHINVISSVLAGVTDLKASQVINSVVADAYNFENSMLLGGSIHGLFATGVGDQYATYAGSDAYLHGIVVFPPGSVTTIDSVWGDPNERWSIDGGVFPGNMIQGDGVGFVMGNLNPAGGNLLMTVQFGGLWTYNGGSPANALQSFSPGITLQTDLGNQAMALDSSRNGGSKPGPALTLGPRPLSPATLDATIQNGGFGASSAIALDSNLQGSYYNWGFVVPTPIPFAQQFIGQGGPADLPGLFLWLRNDFANINASNRTQYIVDSSGLPNVSHDFHLVTGAGLNFGPIEHLPTGLFEFNGGDTSIVPSTAIPGSTNTTLFIPVNTTEGGAFHTIFCTDDIIIYDDVAGSDWGTVNGVVIDSTFNIDDGNVHILAIRTRNFNDLDMYTDGHKVTNISGTSFNSRATCGFGGQFAVQQYTGFAGDVVFYNVLLSDRQMDYVGHWLASKFGGAWQSSPDGSAAWTPGTFANSTSVSTTVPTPGAIVGQQASAAFSLPVPAGGLVTAAVTSPNVVTVTVGNQSGGNITLGAGTVTVQVFQH
jgi:hypothetical protein